MQKYGKRLEEQIEILGGFFLFRLSVWKY